MQELLARDALLAGLAIFLKERVQALVGQLAHDDQVVARALDALDREKEWMPDRFDPLDGAQLFVGTRRAAVQVIEGAMHELGGLVQPAGGFALPHLAEAAAADRLDQSISRQNLLAGTTR